MSAGLPLTHMRHVGTNAAKSSPKYWIASEITPPTVLPSKDFWLVPAISLIDAKSRRVATYKDYRLNR